MEAQHLIVIYLSETERVILDYMHQGRMEFERKQPQVKKRKTELAQYETVDCGKPIVEAEADMVSLGTC